ncbi:hypothetical protein [Enterococcus faecalis]|uniref:hypothetical protein n=1 Tax=Enterococcus faecalis TaxID=1351 RepID=UPI002543D579|nr:hypothetical protein [Enterococcus faecalis]MDK4411045.1 hypothetical protein [Enterococcus faecalis]MDT2096129.1 hypothetical protein [Enterococcus faecalis]
MTEFEYVAIKYRNNKMTRKNKKFESYEKLVNFLKTPQGRKYRGEVRETVLLQSFKSTIK